MQIQAIQQVKKIEYQQLQGAEVTEDSIKNIDTVPWTCLKSGPF